MKEERVAILISGAESGYIIILLSYVYWILTNYNLTYRQKVIGIPLIENSTGLAQMRSAIYLIDEWEVKDSLAFVSTLLRAKRVSGTVALHLLRASLNVRFCGCLVDITYKNFMLSMHFRLSLEKEVDLTTWFLRDSNLSGKNLVRTPMIYSFLSGQALKERRTLPRFSTKLKRPGIGLKLILKKELSPERIIGSLPNWI